MVSLSLVPSLLSSQVAAVEERNLRYEAVVLSHKVADGGYVARPTQTANNPQKNQNDMAAPSALRDFGVQVMYIRYSPVCHGTCSPLLCSAFSTDTAVRTLEQVAGL